MENSDSDPKPEKKLCLSRSIGSQITAARIAKESEASRGPHGLAEFIAAKVDPKTIPKTPEEKNLWIELNRRPSDESKAKRFILPDASNPYM